VVITLSDHAGASVSQSFECFVQPGQNDPQHWPLAWNNETSALSMAVGVFYEIYLNALATGGTPPYTFDVPPGSLPDGLDMTSDGHLSGTPTEAGDKTIVITLSDDVGTPPVSQSFT